MISCPSSLSVTSSRRSAIGNGADAAAAPKAELLELYRGWPAPVEVLIDATEPPRSSGVTDWIANR
jgi:hypothetical protein